MFPVFSIVMDEDVTREKVKAYPALYRTLQKGRSWIKQKYVYFSNNYSFNFSVRLLPLKTSVAGTISSVDSVLLSQKK